MNTDDLDAMPDAQLSEAFAEELAGMGPKVEEWNGRHYTRPDAPPFATSSNAVLPFLERATKHGAPPIEMAYMDGAWLASFHNYSPSIRATAPTFARCACIALLRARRSA